MSVRTELAKLRQQARQLRNDSDVKAIRASTSPDATFPPAACPSILMSITVIVMTKSVAKTAPAALSNSRLSER